MEHDRSGMTIPDLPCFILEVLTAVTNPFPCASLSPVLHLLRREVIILRNYGRNQGRILATNYPELAKEWNYDRNGALTPWMVTTGSNKKVWWTCSLGHEWETAIANRTRYSIGCPYCAGRKAWAGINDLATPAAEEVPGLRDP